MAAITPPTLDELRRTLRPAIGELPEILRAWPRGEGPLADVPLLGPGDVAPKAFESLSGTVRVASVTTELVTVAGLLETSAGGVLATAIVVSPTDLSAHAADATDDVDWDRASRGVLAAAGATEPGLLVEVVALLSPLQEGGPAAGVGVARPLAFADPKRFPHPEDDTSYPEATLEAARVAAQGDGELLCDLGGDPMMPIGPDLAQLWGPLFTISRSATVGLAARAARRS